LKAQIKPDLTQENAQLKAFKLCDENQWCKNGGGGHEQNDIKISYHKNWFGFMKQLMKCQKV
jgi:hypothetical protein